MHEKLLLHTQWKTTHFGHHHPKEEQQQAAVNWINAKSKYYLLVNEEYLNKCFQIKDSIYYDSFHSKKWLLFSGTLCQANSNEYTHYSSYE